MADGRDFGTMVERMGRELRRDNLTTEIKEAIVDSIRYYENERFSFNETSSVVITTANDPYLSSLPAGLLSVDRAELDQGGSRYPLSQQSYEWMTSTDNGNSTGPPYDYALYQGGMRLYPVPDQAYSVHLSYQVQLTEVSASATSTATNAWMTDAEPLIRSHAKGLVFLHRLRNPNDAKYMEYMAEKEYNRLKSKDAGKVARGAVTKTRF